MPAARGGIAAAVLKGVGGELPDKIFANNEIYNPQAKSWTKKQPMPTTLHGLMAVAVGISIYVIRGGPTTDISFANLNEMFHVVV